MIKLLRFLWTGSWHEHKWKTVSVGSLKYSESGYVGTCKRITLVCASCGIYKIQDLKK